MKNIKRWFSVLVACAVIAAGLPTAFVAFGDDSAIPSLKTAENFSGGSEGITVSSGASFEMIPSGAVGGGNAVKVDPSGTGSWSLVELNVPLDGLTVGNAKGLLIYTEWNDNLNFYITLSGQSGGASFTAAPEKYNQPPLFDTLSNSWKTNGESGNAGAVAVGGSFKGYVYVPFSALDNELSSDAVINQITFRGFHTDSHKAYAIGSIYLVENDVLPEKYYGSPELSSDVLLDGGAVSLVRQLELATLDDFTSGTSNYTASSGVKLETADGTRAVGGGDTLNIDASAAGDWGGWSLEMEYSADAAGAYGILIYAKWGGNPNFKVTVEGLKDGGGVSGTFAQWNSNIPLYDTVADEWIPSPESDNAGALHVPEQFEGYVYIPFGKILSGGLDSITKIKIGTFNEDGKSSYSLGGIFLVVSDVLPDAYTDGMSNTAVLDGAACSLSNKPFDPDAVIAEYTQRLESIIIDGEFYKQADKDALVAEMETLKEKLAAAETSGEQEALIAEFDELFNNFVEGPEADIVFATVSDIHLNGSGERISRLNKFLSDVKTAAPDAMAVLSAGDLTDNGTEAEFESYWSIIESAAPEGVTVLSAMGNHDARGDFLGGASQESRWNAAKSRYLNGLNEYLGTSCTDTYYHMEIGGYDFIVLNTENADKDTATISETQQEWFKAKLAEISAAKPGKPIFVMLHQPLTDTHPGTTVFESTVGASGKALKAIVAEYPQTVFMSGHIHNGVGYSDIINDGKGIYLDLPSIYSNTTGNTSVTLAYYVSVHGDLVRFRVRDFQSGEWLNEYEKIVKLSGVTPVDKDDLREAYYLYRGTGRGRYSEESWNTFTTALENAHTVLNDTTETQAEIDSALKTLEDAVSGLVVEPIKLAADNEAMELEILQDFADFDASPLNNGSAKAEVKNSGAGIDGVNSLETGGASGDVSFDIPFKEATGLSEANAVMAYIKLPTAETGGTSFRVKLQLKASGTAVDMSGATLTYLDNTSQSWFECSPDGSGYYAMPTAFEGYIRISFDAEQLDAPRNADTLSVAYQAADGKTVTVGTIYSVLKDTAGITAVIDGKAERYIENGKEPTEDQKQLYQAAMKAETLHSFKGYTSGGSAIGDLVTPEYVNKNDITVTYEQPQSSILPGNHLEFDADTMHSYWPGDNVTEEYAYFRVKYPENTYLDDMAALMFYVETSQSNPTSEDPFTTKVFFDLHTRGADNGEVWSNTASYQTLYFLAEGSTEWQRLESDTGHILLPTGAKGYVLAPIDSFSQNPISTTLEGRKAIDTTFIFSGFGGDMGSVKIGGIWSVLDYADNNLLVSYNGSEVWNLSNGNEAVIDDLNSGSKFPEEENLIDELPSATVTDYQIHQPSYEDITDTTVRLSWDAYPGAASYNVRIYQTVYSGTGIKYRVVAEKNVTGTSAVLEGLEPLNWYYAVVEALDEDGDIIAIYPNLLFQSADSEYGYIPGGNGSLNGGSGLPVLGESGSVIIWNCMLAVAFVLMMLSRTSLINRWKNVRLPRR